MPASKAFRNYTVDSLRILASVFVVFMHAKNNGASTDPNIYAPGTNQNFIAVMGFTARLAVPFFMGISGFYFYKNDKQLMQERCLPNIKSIIKILLPAWGCINLVCFLLDVFVYKSSVGNELVEMLKFKPYYFFFNYRANIILWYMFCLIFVYFICYLFLLFKKFNYIYIFLLIGYTVLYLEFFSSKDPRDLGMPVLLSRALPCFICGMLARQIVNKYKNLKITAPILLLATYLLHLWLSLKFNADEIAPPLFALAALLTANAYPNLGHRTGLPDFGKKYAKNLYIAHLFIIEYFVSKWTVLLWISWPVSVVICLTGAIAYHKIKDKITSK